MAPMLCEVSERLEFRLIPLQGVSPYVIHSGMAHAVSVRLDDEVHRALRTLEASGLSRSEAIRKSILDAAAALHHNDAIRAEVAALEADEADRQEMQEVALLMESLRAEG